MLHEGFAFSAGILTQVYDETFTAAGQWQIFTTLSPFTLAADPR